MQESNQIKRIPINGEKDTQIENPETTNTAEGLYTQFNLLEQDLRKVGVPEEDIDKLKKGTQAIIDANNRGEDVKALLNNLDTISAQLTKERQTQLMEDGDVFLKWLSFRKAVELLMDMPTQNNAPLLGSSRLLSEDGDYGDE